MTDKYSYRFLPIAENDLVNTVLYIEQELSNPKAAKDFTIKLSKKIDDTRVFPLSGKAIDNKFIADKGLRQFAVGNYIVFYKPDKETETIIILRIIYGGRDIDEILKTL